MSTSISQRLLKLRKEKELSQKEAAEALGISQALLSHYEKGIRECGLDFLCKASVFYDVSSDYLLGLSETRISPDAGFDLTDIPQDSEIKTKTILRAAAAIYERMGNVGNAHGDKCRAIYILIVYTLYLRAASLGIMPANEYATLEMGSFLSSGTIDSILSTITVKEPQKSKKNDRLPVCIDTVSREAVNIIKRQYDRAFKKSEK
ncbi:MAG: helix-turn-helix transcriptional regulator [Oscillospiraceae bacterium]|nr:helix-turn-helix transcriptional regulator [Oscillospiraceae bacterium]